MKLEIVIDPDFQALIPPLSTEELGQLDVNLQAHGCLMPIVTWEDQGIILDGHNRYAICARRTIPFETLELPFASREEAMGWMIDNQLGRRNISASQRAILEAKKRTFFSGKPSANVANIRENEAKSKSAPGALFTQTEAADNAHVSPRTMKQAIKVIKEGTPELQAAVVAGKISVKRAAEIADKPKAQQQKAMVTPPEPDPAAYDLRGTPLPNITELACAFGPDSERLNAMLSDLLSLSKNLNMLVGPKSGEFGGVPGGKHLVASEQNLRRAIKEIRSNVTLSIPFALCPYCGGVKSSKCLARCQGGWMTEYQWEKVTKEVKAKWPERKR